MNWRDRRKIRKNREVIAQGFHDLLLMSVTFHGRLQLAEVINDGDNGLDPYTRRMYLIALETAPVEDWAMDN